MKDQTLLLTVARHESDLSSLREGVAGLKASTNELREMMEMFCLAMVDPRSLQEVVVVDVHPAIVAGWGKSRSQECSARGIGVPMPSFRGSRDSIAFSSCGQAVVATVVGLATAEQTKAMFPAKGASAATGLPVTLGGPGTAADGSSAGAPSLTGVPLRPSGVSSSLRQVGTTARTSSLPTSRPTTAGLPVIMGEQEEEQRTPPPPSSAGGSARNAASNVACSSATGGNNLAAPPSDRPPPVALSPAEDRGPREGAPPPCRRFPLSASGEKGERPCFERNRAPGLPLSPLFEAERGNSEQRLELPLEGLDRFLLEPVQAKTGLSRFLLGPVQAKPRFGPGSGPYRPIHGYKSSDLDPNQLFPTLETGCESKMPLDLIQACVSSPKPPPEPPP